MLIDDVGEILVTKYGSEQGFVSAYSTNPRKVFRTIIGLMKVIPVDLKQMLSDTHKSLTTTAPDQYVA
uniref:Uncharacterized protein n=1 Tax=viral metagenome TaxID=1070528 RepID=A0A6H1ZI80_9ZZZZ